MIQRENTSRKFLIFNLKIQFIFSLASAGPQGGALLKKMPIVLDLLQEAPLPQTK